MAVRFPYALTLSSYAARWYGSGQISARAVCGEAEPGAAPPSAYGEPCLEPFDSVDASEGGSQARHSAALAPAATLARERGQELLAARCVLALKGSEASPEHAATEVARELVLHEGRQRRDDALVGGGLERAVVVGDDPVELAELGLPDFR